MAFDSSMASPNLLKISEQLRLYEPPPAPPQDDSQSDSIEEEAVEESAIRIRPKRAAVLVCLFEGDQGEVRVILTKRSSTLSTHSGEVSFPGGKVEEGDADDIDTALREAKEEIGLDPSLVNVVTIFEPFVTKLGITVVPVVGILSDKSAFDPVLNAGEVEAIFDAPLEMFLKDENRRGEEREWMGDKYLLHHFYYAADNKNYKIWALTAGILIRTASIAYQRPPAFLERRPNFWSGVAKNDTSKM